MRALLYAGLAAYWAACIWWARTLPDRYPVHFGISGEPDRWTTSSFEWYLLPAIATATILLMMLVGHFAHRSPGLWNVPEKKRFLALSSEQRAPILVELAQVLDIAGLYTLAVFVVCQWTVYRSALSGRGSLNVLFHVVVWGGMVILLLLLLRINARVRRMILAADLETSVGRAS